MSSNALPSRLHSFPLVLLCSLLVMSGCTTAPGETAVDNPQLTWQSRQPELAAIKVWRLSGRVAVSQGGEAWNLNMDWQQDGDDYQIQLYGPFGSGRVKLVGNAYGVLLHDADDQTFYADKAQTLLYEHTGVTMPVEGLRYWIVGLTSPTQSKQPRLDSQGRLAYLEDANWQVNFKRYTDVSGMQLPHKVFIVEPDNQIDVRLVIDTWKLGAL